MTGQSRGRRAKWLRVAFVVSAAIALHALVGSAQAAAVDGRTLATARVAAVGGGGSPAWRTLAGFTSQHFPVFFKVSNDGKMVLAGGIGISMTCTSGGTVVWPDAFARVPIHPDGRLQANYASPTILTNGTASSMSDALTARLNPKHSQLSGTWQLSANFTFPDGTTDHCDSGPVSFSATK